MTRYLHLILLLKLRPPQPAVYLFLLDISRLAIESGYLHTVCEVLSSLLSSLPGDARTQIGFIAYNSTLHFFSLAEGLSQPHEMVVLDVDGNKINYKLQQNCNFIAVLF